MDVVQIPMPAQMRMDCPDGHVAEWLRNGLQNRVPRFNSGRGLHSLKSKLSGIRLSRPARQRGALDSRIRHRITEFEFSFLKTLLPAKGVCAHDSIY
jgi:hypothetical protein